jgi:threonine dehydratase
MTHLDRTRLLQIRARVSPHLNRTPLLRSGTLSRLAGCNVWLKAELFQKTGSYKPRGMLWSLYQLSDEERRRGVITFSAGNAAQGLAYAGGIVGARVTVTMPATASPTKAQATRDYGAEVILHGNAKECLAHCRQLAADRGLTFISSYDDSSLMQGHATLGLEILEEAPQIDAVLLGVGGGGMLGGIALALQALGSTARLIGVEPHGAPAMARSFESGKAVMLDAVDTIADGLAAPGAGQLCYEIARERTDRIVIVTDEEIVAAMKLLMERCKLFAEPAGAAAVAGLLSQRAGLTPGSNVVCIVSGGNLDLQRLKSLL